MADSDQTDQGAAKPAAITEDSVAIKALLSVVDALGSSMSATDLAKFETLIERARASDLANG